MQKIWLDSELRTLICNSVLQRRDRAFGEKMLKERERESRLVFRSMNSLVDIFFQIFSLSLSFPLHSIYFAIIHHCMDAKCLCILLLQRVQCRCSLKYCVQIQVNCIMQCDQMLLLAFVARIKLKIASISFYFLCFLLYPSSSYSPLFCAFIYSSYSVKFFFIRYSSTVVTFAIFICFILFSFSIYFANLIRNFFLSSSFASILENGAYAVVMVLH